jgi:hypothetical protein
MNVVWTKMEYENMTQGHLDYGTTMTGQSVCEVYHCLGAGLVLPPPWF